MIDELDMCEEEAAACLFFMGAWRLLGDGPEMREKVLFVMSREKLDRIPDAIKEHMARRFHKSMMENNHEWVDRAYTGYKALVNEMYGRMNHNFNPIKATIR